MVPESAPPPRGQPQSLSDTDQHELARIVGKHDSALLALVYEAVNVRLLTDAEVDALAAMLLDVFEASLNGTDEPSEQGEQADRLAGLLQQQRLSYWQ